MYLIPVIVSHVFLITASGNSQVRVMEMSNHIFPKPTDSAVYTPLPTTSSPNSHLQTINLEQHLRMRRGGRSFVKAEWRPFVEEGGGQGDRSLT